MHRRVTFLQNFVPCALLLVSRCDTVMFVVAVVGIVLVFVSAVVMDSVASEWQFLLIVLVDLEMLWSSGTDW